MDGGGGGEETLQSRRGLVGQGGVKNDREESGRMSRVRLETGATSQDKKRLARCCTDENGTLQRLGRGCRGQHSFISPQKSEQSDGDMFSKPGGDGSRETG